MRRKGASDEDADEIWNDAFLAVIERAGTIEPLGLGLKPFALSVANRRWIDRVRVLTRMPTQSLPDDSSAPIPSTSPPDPGRMAAVEACSERARPSYREVLEMASRGLTAAEIAAILDMSEANAAKIDPGQGTGSGSASRARSAMTDDLARLRAEVLAELAELQDMSEPAGNDEEAEDFPLIANLA